MLKPALTAFALLSTLAAARAEGAEPAPTVRSASDSTQFISLGAGLQVVEHQRQPGEVAASFKVERRPVPTGVQVVFELFSIRDTERVLRWRCVAVHDTEECFPRPVIVGFQARDQLLRLEVLATDPSGEAASNFRLALAP